MGTIKTFNEFINESTWNSRPDISRGTFGAKKVITTNRDLRKKIEELYKEQGEGDTLDVSSLTNCIKCDDFSSIFKDFYKVKHIIGLEDWDVSNVKDMRCMFYNCKYFNSNLSKWDVSNVENMDSMFWGCKNFNSDLSKWNVSNVENTHNMFYNCKTFKSDLSKWDVSNVENMYCMFWGCINFNSDLSKWNVSNVKNIHGMFSGCQSLGQLPSWYMN